MRAGMGMLPEENSSRDFDRWEVWIAGLWIVIQASRPVSYWLGLVGIVFGPDGNGADTISYMGLMLLAWRVLRKRNVDWGCVLRENKALMCLYGFFALSILWSDIPGDSTKRIIKDFGCVFVALIFLVQKNPAEAIRYVYSRAACLLFPLSIILIKYFPAIGRHQTNAGNNMFRGVASHKNSLGLLVFIFGLIIIWDIVERRKRRRDRANVRWLRIEYGLVVMGASLMLTCNSKTSLLCCILAVVIAWGSAKLARMRQGKAVLICCIVGVISLAAMDKGLGISASVIRALGKNPDLTGRTKIWEEVRSKGTDALIGNGFYAFWDSSKGSEVKEELAVLKTAHNGYLEIYLDGGVVGLTLLGIWLLSSGSIVIGRLFARKPFENIGLTVWSIAIVYNISESSFLRLDSLWILLLMMSVRYSKQPSARRAGLRDKVRATSEGPDAGSVAEPAEATA